MTQYNKVYFLLRQNPLHIQAVLQGGHIQSGDKASQETQHGASGFPVAGKETTEKPALGLKCFHCKGTHITVLPAYWTELVTWPSPPATGLRNIFFCTSGRGGWLEMMANTSYVYCRHFFFPLKGAPYIAIVFYAVFIESSLYARWCFNCLCSNNEKDGLEATL